MDKKIQYSVPDGFKKNEEGLFYYDGAQWIKFYDYDLYICQLSYDASQSYEIMTIKHHLPHDGWIERTLRSSLAKRPKDLIMKLADNHVHVVGKEKKKLLVKYIRSILAEAKR